MVNNTENQTKHTQLGLIPVSKWNDYYEYPTVGAIRQLIYYNTDNFETKVVRKIGNRLYIKVSEFNEWVEKINGKVG